MPEHDVGPATLLSNIVKRYLTGEHPGDIAADLGLPAAQVNRQLAVARRRWSDGARFARSEAHSMLTELEALEAGFRKEWARLGPVLSAGCRDQEELTKDRDRDDDVDGDSAHMLQVAAYCLLTPPLLKSPHLEAGVSSPLADEYVDGLSPEEVQHEITRLAHGLGLRKTKTSR